MSSHFSPAAEQANRHLAADFEAKFGIDAAFLLKRTRPHTLATFLRTPIPMSCVGAVLVSAALVWLHIPALLALLALPIGYVAVTVLGYGVLRWAGERGMAMGAQAVTYTQRPWESVRAAEEAIGPSLFHGWVHLAGRRGLIQLHNSVAVAAGYLLARELGRTYRIHLFHALEQTVESGYKLGGWTDLERDVRGETRGPIGWVREWTKYQYLGHSRKAYVLGGLTAGRALRLADDKGIDPWQYLRRIALGEGLVMAEALMPDSVDEGESDGGAQIADSDVHERA